MHNDRASGPLDFLPPPLDGPVYMYIVQTCPKLLHCQKTKHDLQFYVTNNNCTLTMVTTEQ